MVMEIIEISYQNNLFGGMIQMRLDEFDYDLDKELIAQTPLEKRDGSRLMVLDCKEKKVEDKMFPDLLQILSYP